MSFGGVAALSVCDLECVTGFFDCARPSVRVLVGRSEDGLAPDELGCGDDGAGVDEWVSGSESVQSAEDLVEM